MAHYTDYYDSQIGGGYSTKFRVFAGSPYQRGHGIGSFLGGLFRRVLPLLSRGARAVGKEAVRAGMNILTDVSERGAPLKQAFRTRAAESGMNLKRKAEAKIDELMKGSGYKAVKRSRGAHSIIGIAGRSIASRAANKRKRRTGKART
ncbi:uncharacterized protein LOC112494814, partial [Cephus cinctus]|uniref:Uncharacterized protein LOC112494814 n=1 Tax=Cephus cinctus TaxID=211228 RepID=A0AAJ7RMZ9_CEPCN